LARGSLPEDVERLLREHIFSVEQLEILLLLRAQPSRGFDAKYTSDELRSSASSAAACLADLTQRGFLSCQEHSDPKIYFYLPNSDWLKQAVEQLNEAYAQRRYTVMERIFSKPIEVLSVFASAFRFRKDDSDG